MIGPGSVGTALAIRCRRAGLSLRTLVGRTPEASRRAAERVGAGEACSLDEWATSVSESGADPPEPIWLLLTVRDDAISRVAETVATTLGRIGVRLDGSIAVHASGALAHDVLEPLRSVGARLASVHPLRSFADPERAAEDFQGTWCFHDEDSEITASIVSWIEAIGGRAASLASDAKPLYHAAASLASNGTVALLQAAARMLEAAGIERPAATEALVALVAGTLDNAAAVGVPAALTGPADRGDGDSLVRHRTAIDTRLPDVAELYTNVQLAAVDAALAKGSIDASTAAELRSRLRGAGS